MDPVFSLQDVTRCHICNSTSVQLICKTCNVKLCKECAGQHLLDGTKEHKVLPLFYQKNAPKYPTCLKHTTKQCERYCRECDIPICIHCVHRNHQQHPFDNLLEKCEIQNGIIQRDLEELEKTIYPKYQEAASMISIQKADIYTHSLKLSISISKQAYDWHKEIDIIINKLKTEIEKSESNQLMLLKKQEENVTRRISEITQSIADLKKLVDSDDVSLLLSYKSRNAEFKRWPSKLKVSLPTFFSEKINIESLQKQFGFLSIPQS